MIKKTIQINPDLFTLTKKKSKSKKKKKINPFSSALKPNSVKKQLIERVKAHHKKKKEQLQHDLKTEQENETFTSDFTNTFKYLEDLQKNNEKKKRKKREKRRKNKTVKRNDIDSYANKPPPPYSNLKNSNKPTWREYNKTLKKKYETNENPVVSIGDGEKIAKNPENDVRKNKLEELKEKFNEVVATVDDTIVEKPNLVEKSVKESFEKKSRRKRRKFKTKKVKRKLTLGKDLKKRTVGVLIKNKQTRKKIKNDFTKLQTKTSVVVKKYLLKHNMMKVGSTAPEELLRATYENCYLSGDVINKNPEILLHNYMQES